MDAASIATLVGQLGFAVAAWRLATKVAARQDADAKRIDGHEVRITVLEKTQ